MEGEGISSFANFGFSDVDIDTKFLEIDDVDKNKHKNTSAIRELYTKINGDFTVDKKYGKKFTIPFETSPKIGLTSNNPIGGVSSSSDKRYHVVEFSPYWNRQLKINGTIGIRKYFNRRLFDEWDDTEWIRFYNFGFQCIQEYLKTGLYAPVRKNYKRKQLLTEMDEEVLNWITNWIEEDCPKLGSKKHLGEELDVIWSNFITETRNTNVDSRQLKKHIKLVAETYGHEFFTNHGGRLLYTVNGKTTEFIYVKTSFFQRMKRTTKEALQYLSKNMDISDKYMPWE